MMRGERDEGKRAVLLEALRAGTTVSAAAKAAGCHRQLVYSLIRRGDAELAAAVAARKGQGRRSDLEASSGEIGREVQTPAALVERATAAQLPTAWRPGDPPPDPPAGDTPQRAEVLWRLQTIVRSGEDKDSVAAARLLLQELPRPVAAAAAGAAPGAEDEAPAPAERVDAELELFRFVPEAG